MSKLDYERMGKDLCSMGYAKDVTYLQGMVGFDDGWCVLVNDEWEYIDLSNEAQNYALRCFNRVDVINLNTGNKDIVQASTTGSIKSEWLDADIFESRREACNEVLNLIYGGEG